MHEKSTLCSGHLKIKLYILFKPILEELTKKLLQKSSLFHSLLTYLYLIRNVYLQSWHKVLPVIFSLNWSLQIILTHFSLVLHSIQKPVVWFTVQSKWLVSIWNTTLGWNGSKGYLQYMTFSLNCCLWNIVHHPL